LSVFILIIKNLRVHSWWNLCRSIKVDA
jgi:hypothetical protein